MAVIGEVLTGPADRPRRSLRLNPAVLAPLVSPLALLAIWYWVASREIFPEQILVPPGVVLEAFRELTESGELQEHLGISLYRLTLGFLIGALSGLIFGVLLALSRQVRDYAGSLFQALRQIPTLALIPMFILFFGIGETLKVVIIVKATFFPVAVAAWDGVKGIPTQYLEVGHLYRLKRRDLWLRLVLPAAVSPLLTGIRIALGRSWLVLVAVELLAADSGIGQMMELARQMMRLDIVMVGVFVTGIIGFALDKGFRLLERLLLRGRIAEKTT